MIPLIGMPSPVELLIILAIILLLFGGTRLAGLGKSTGRAIKEFKEETGAGADKQSDDVVDAEVVDPEAKAEQSHPAVSGQESANGTDQTATNGAEPRTQPSQSRGDS